MNTNNPIGVDFSFSSPTKAPDQSTNSRAAANILKTLPTYYLLVDALGLPISNVKYSSRRAARNDQRYFSFTVRTGRRGRPGYNLRIAAVRHVVNVIR